MLQSHFTASYAGEDYKKSSFGPGYSVGRALQRLQSVLPAGRGLVRELYREVCALLFFRFGQTPTANRHATHAVMRNCWRTSVPCMRARAAHMGRHAFMRSSRVKVCT
jgi:hypothetical protein